MVCVVCMVCGQSVVSLRSVTHLERVRGETSPSLRESPSRPRLLAGSSSSLEVSRVMQSTLEVDRREVEPEACGG